MHTARGVVLTKVRMRQQAFRDDHKRQLIAWALGEQSRGVSPVIVARINLGRQLLSPADPSISLLGFRHRG